MSKTICLSREDLERRRAAILKSVRMTEDELRERAREFMLQPHERVAFESIRAIDLLLEGR